MANGSFNADKNASHFCRLTWSTSASPFVKQELRSLNRKAIQEWIHQDICRPSELR
jgi:hypothetical protein